MLKIDQALLRITISTEIRLARFAHRAPFRMPRGIYLQTPTHLYAAEARVSFRWLKIGQTALGITALTKIRHRNFGSRPPLPHDTRHMATNANTFIFGGSPRKLTAPHGS